MDEGWTRYVLDAHDVPYVSVDDAAVRRGGLRERFDVVLLPSSSAGELRGGRAPGTAPPDYCGGLGDAGAAALAAFVREGGRLVCVERATDYALELFAGATDVVEVAAALDPATFSAPGALLAVDVAEDAARSGTPRRLVVPFVDSRAFDLPATTSRAGPAPVVLARYAAKDPVVSGWMLGAERIAGKIMALSVRVGAGEVVLFGAPVVFRAQTEAAFPLLFDALLR